MQEFLSYLFRDVNNSNWATPRLDEAGRIPVAATGGGGTQFAEDAAHVSGDLGNLALSVANDANLVFAADGDYVPVGTDTEGSVRSIGNRAHATADAGRPVKIGGQARTTNPTAVADANRVNFTSDKLGRQLITPYQVRDLVSSARLVLSTGTEATLLAAVAGVFLDLVMVKCSNTSDVAAVVDFRSVSTGNIEFSIQVPASGTTGFAPPVPWPQGNTGNPWTADIADITGTTINIEALFVQNI